MVGSLEVHQPLATMGDRIILNSELRVLHIIPRMLGRGDGVMGGAERYALELARYMAEDVPTSLVCFGDGEESYERVGRLDIHVIGKAWCVRGQRQNPMALRLWRDLRKAQVVHCHQQHILASSFAAAACRLTGRKVFVSDLGGGGWDISAYISTDRWYHGHLHISEYSRTIYGHANQRRAHVILGGVDTEKFSPHPSVQRKPRVLFVGRLVPHKGVDDLINALPPDLALEVIGQPYDERYAAELKRLAQGKQVVFRSDCDDQALVQAYRSAMCIVLPSVYQTIYGPETKVPELLGQTLLEGMSCETPAICTNVASLPEVVEDDVTGFVVPPNDPQALRDRLAWMRERPEQSRTMGRAGRLRILQKFTWGAVVRRCLELYQSPTEIGETGFAHPQRPSCRVSDLDDGNTGAR
jgi:glycosyltransferase involved in cell wall biosynthesis